MFSTGLIGLTKLCKTILFCTTFGMIDKCAICLLKEGLQKLFSVYMAEVAEVSVLMSGQRAVGIYCLHSFALFFSSRPSTWHVISLQFLAHFSPSLLVFPAFCYPFANSTLKSPSFAFSSLFCCALPDNEGIPGLCWWGVGVGMGGTGAVRACL